MASDALKLAKIERERELGNQVMSLLSHPVYSIVASIIVIEALQQIHLSSGEYFMSRAGTVLEAALLGEGVLDSLSKSGVLEQLFTQGGKGIEAMSKLAPLLLAAG